MTAESNNVLDLLDLIIIYYYDISIQKIDFRNN